MVDMTKQVLKLLLQVRGSTPMFLERSQTTNAIIHNWKDSDWLFRNTSRDEIPSWNIKISQVPEKSSGTYTTSFRQMMTTMVSKLDI